LSGGSTHRIARGGEGGSDPCRRSREAHILIRRRSQDKPAFRSSHYSYTGTGNALGASPAQSRDNHKLKRTFCADGRASPASSGSKRLKLSCRDSIDSVSACPSSLEQARSEEHTSELQSRENLVCRLLLEKKKKKNKTKTQPEKEK